MLVQLNPPLHMNTPKGPGWRAFLHRLWSRRPICCGSCSWTRTAPAWTVPNPEVRLSFNWTLGRRRAEQADVSANDKVAPPAAQRFRPTLAATES